MKKSGTKWIDNQQSFLKQFDDSIFVGTLDAAIQTELLLENGITHILNLSSKQYTKRHHVIFPLYLLLN